MNILLILFAAGRNTLVACILLALFIGSVVFEVVSLNPRHRVLGLVSALAVALLVFYLLLLIRT